MHAGLMLLQMTASLTAGMAERSSTSAAGRDPTFTGASTGLARRRRSAASILRFARTALQRHKKMLLAATSASLAAALSSGPSASEWREFRARLAGRSLGTSESSRNAAALRQIVDEQMWQECVQSLTQPREENQCGTPFLASPHT